MCEYAADILTCAGVVFSIQWLASYSEHSAQSMRDALATAVLVGLLSAILLKRHDLDEQWHPLHPVRETEAAIRMSGQVGIVLLPTSYLLLPQVSGRWLLLSLVLIPLLLSLQKKWLAIAIRRVSYFSSGPYRVIVYGASEAGRRIASALASSTRGKLRSVAVVDEDALLANRCRVELAYGRASEISVQCAAINADLLTSLRCDLLILAAPDLSVEKRAGLLAAAADAGSQVTQLSQVHPDPRPAREFLEIGGLQLTREKTRRVSATYALGKRAFDVLLSIFLLVALSPVLLFISLLVGLSSAGPVVFVQKRVGLNGRVFRMYKFRSMASHARKYECSPKASTDSRITAVGRFLRRTSLDELPQLLNVLRGDMSLVGPRPEMPFIVQGYTPQQRERLQVLPGITGLWQLSADRAYPIHDNLHHDLSYIRDRSFCLDLAILMDTLLFAMKAGI
jgi:exopolysaccharide biosynthesis polyprenyl glycosylphosphotransferase